MVVPVAVSNSTVAPVQKDWAAAPAGTAGVTGCALITALPEAEEVHPVAIVT